MFSQAQSLPKDGIIIHFNEFIMLVQIYHSQVTFLIQCFRDEKSNLKGNSECIIIYFKAGD